MPSEIMVVTEIPLLGSGKTDYVALGKMVLASAGGSSDPTQTAEA